MIEGLLGTKLKQQTFQEAHNGDGYYLITDNYPIQSITSFELDNGGTWDSVPKVRFNSSGVIGYKTPVGFQNVRITYVAGYVIDWSDANKHTLPADISELAKRFALRQYRKLGNEGEKTSNYTNSSLTWDDLIDATDKEIISKYQRLTIM